MTAKQVQIRRDSATNLNAATPADGELGYDTTNDELRIGDGATTGGIHIPNSKMIQAQTYTSVNAGGTADAITLTLAPVPAAYVTYQRFVFKAASSNATTTPTININGLGAKNIKKKSASGKVNPAIGDIQNGCIYAVVYDGTDMQLEAVDSSAGGTNVQSFSSGGTWTKPSSGTWAFVRGWGGGASGGKGATNGGGGGGGASYAEAWFLLASLGSTETVTVGAGGASQTSANTAGNAGGNSTFGSWLTAYGGGRGGGSSGGAGGGGGGSGFPGTSGVGGDATTVTAGTGGPGWDNTAGAAASANGPIYGGGGGNSGGGSGGKSHSGGGGGGGASGSGGGAGGSSLNGGGGGGGGGPSVGFPGGAGGVSQAGGSGGAGAYDANNGTAGSSPGGGGGGCETGNSGAGGDGKIVVIVV